VGLFSVVAIGGAEGTEGVMVIVIGVSMRVGGEIGDGAGEPLHAVANNVNRIRTRRRILFPKPCLVSITFNPFRLKRLYFFVTLCGQLRSLKPVAQQ